MQNDTIGNIIRELGKKYSLYGSVAFEKIFRDIAVHHTSNSLCAEISEDEFAIIQEVKDTFSDLLFEEDSHLLLWICRCLYFHGKSVLSILNGYINAVCNIKRGNLNTYKLNGWDVHILYVYQLSNYNFPKAIVPTAYCWNFDVGDIFAEFKNYYVHLSPDAKFILRVGSFLHDIGVTEGVEDHELKGVPLTEKYYAELSIPESTLNRIGVTLNHEEVIVALKVLVGNHQMLNQIACEVSDKFIYEKMCAIRGAFAFSPRLMKIYKEDFVDLMSVLAISDMMAVDDSLLTQEKYLELIDSHDFLSQITKNGIYQRDSFAYGIKRFVSLLRDDLKGEASEEIRIALLNAGESGIKVADFLYNVKHLSYGMAAIKPLGDIKKSLKLIFVCERLADSSLIPVSELKIKFNPNINNEKLSSILDFSIDFIVENGLLNPSFDELNNTISLTC